MMASLLYLALYIHTVVAVDHVAQLGYASYEGTTLQNGLTQWLGESNVREFM